MKLIKSDSENITITFEIDEIKSIRTAMFEFIDALPKNRKGQIIPHSYNIWGDIVDVYEELTKIIVQARLNNDTNTTKNIKRNS